MKPGTETEAGALPGPRAGAAAPLNESNPPRFSPLKTRRKKPPSARPWAHPSPTSIFLNEEAVKLRKAAPTQDVGVRVDAQQVFGTLWKTSPTTRWAGAELCGKKLTDFYAFFPRFFQRFYAQIRARIYAILRIFTGQSLFEKLQRVLFSSKNPPGGGSFGPWPVLGSVVTARCGDAPTSPPWPRPKIPHRNTPRSFQTGPPRPFFFRKLAIF